VTKHTFIYITDSLVGYVSWKQSWVIWLDQAEKEEEYYTISSMEADTHLGKVYLGECSVLLEEGEIDHFEHKGVDLL
jgi:hypothetical protein